MTLGGMKDLISFLNYLDREKIYYRLDHVRDDTVMVSFTLVGARIELDFFDDHVEFSIFKGSEAVEDDVELLFQQIQAHWGDD